MPATLVSRTLSWYRGSPYLQYGRQFADRSTPISVGSEAVSIGILGASEILCVSGDALSGKLYVAEPQIVFDLNPSPENPRNSKSAFATLADERILDIMRAEEMTMIRLCWPLVRPSTVETRRSHVVDHGRMMGVC